MEKIKILLIAVIVISISFFCGCNEQKAIVHDNIPPTAACSANPAIGTTPLTVYFVGSGIDSDGNITSYSWNFGDGEKSTEQNPTHIYQSSGTYTITLTVRDDDGATGTSSIKITVNEAPSNKKPTSSLTTSSNSGDAPFTVTFLMSANDTDGSISFWELDINNDGTAEYSGSDTPPSAKQYTYSEPGTYTVKFIVTDNQGATNSNTVTITVKTPPPKPISLSGYGDDITSSFQLNEGLAIFEMTYSGEHNFIIWLDDANTGEQKELLVNEIGSYSGKTIIGLQQGGYGNKPGRYLLEVTSSGNWQITITQPNPSTAPNLPQTLSGSGDTIPSPFMIESGKGAVKFTLHHSGLHNFIVWLYSISGEQEELLANEIGNYDGTKLVSVGGWSGTTAGISYLGIQADGNWRIDISYV